MTRFLIPHKLTRGGKATVTRTTVNKAIVSTVMVTVSMVILPSCTKAHLALNQGKPAFNSTDSLQLSQQNFINHPRPKSQLQWHTCDNGILHSQCSILEVPLDYKNPTLGTIHVGISRIKARKAQERIGTLFVNSGGPGVPGMMGYR